MNEKEILKQHSIIIKLILNKRLKEALKKLEDQINLGSTIELRNEHSQISTSYFYMLKYMAQGVDDPERHKLHNKLLRDTLTLNDRVKVILLDSVSNRFYYQSRLELKSSTPIKYDEIQKTLENFKDDYAIGSLMDYSKLEPILKNRESSNKKLFYNVWLNIRWSQDDVTHIESILNSSRISHVDKGLLITAITFSLLECFDEEKIKVLLNAYNNPTIEVKQRALVGIAIIFQKYSEWISLFSDICARIEFLNELDSFGDHLNNAYTQLIRSQDTEEIERKMKEEIFPEVMKTASSLKKFDFDDLEASDGDMRNWEEKLEDSDFADKIKEMQEMQKQGEDIYMPTFSLLKNYPFFNEFHHWFYPFDKSLSCIIEELGIDDEEQGSVIDLFLNTNVFCNSDKFSLCFMLKDVPQVYKKKIISELSESEQEEGKRQLYSIIKDPKLIINQYVHDLYRFFKLHSKRNDFEDIFKIKMNLHQIPILKNVLYKTKHLSFLADFFLFKERYLEAIEVFQILIEEMGKNSFLTYQKYGFACQREKRFPEAIKAYLKADLISPSSLWIHRNLALCYRRIQSYEKALEYYKKVEEVQPNHKNTLYYIGVCLTNLEQHDEALNYFFKLDLMNSRSIRTWRSIGWCSFLSGKLEQSERYYSKVLEKSPHMIDYLNSGHIAWASKKIETAIERYKKALELCESRDVFIEKMNSDKKHLIQQGIHEEEIPLLIDLI